MEPWVWTCYQVAFCAFWLQHWIYVSQYTRVAVLVPLTFISQVPEVQKKRNRYLIVINTVDFLAFALIIATTIVSLTKTQLNHGFVLAEWNTLTVILSIALIFSLAKIRYYTKVLSTEGIQSSRTLMMSHSLAFGTGAIVGLIIFLLFISINFDNYNRNSLWQLRVRISIEYFGIINNI